MKLKIMGEQHGRDRAEKGWETNGPNDERLMKSHIPTGDL
jgi:hypothetical protein